MARFLPRLAKITLFMDAVDGLVDGDIVGLEDGGMEGLVEGVVVGETVGLADGDMEGLVVGVVLGDAEGDAVGERVGDTVGPLVGVAVVASILYCNLPALFTPD
eukprot:scaffold23238_cov38-Cyclotella_meneghiniana.AAC.1